MILNNSNESRLSFRGREAIVFGTYKLSSPFETRLCSVELKHRYQPKIRIGTSGPRARVLNSECVRYRITEPYTLRNVRDLR